MEYEHIVHPFGPLYDARSKILILGSLPSVKSREASFFYGHPQNRYWPLMASLLGEPVPATVEEKKELVLSHRIAMWDSIYSCDIRGSGDSSIRNVVPTDLKPVIEGSEITAVFCNGGASYKYYRRFQEKELGIGAVVLPSTSPANAAWSFERLREEWKVILEYL
ncbi:MAG: DNA-deoxyinosine glycosylase [Firmicutes bacterium]|nr:DNA-deoxyinosine glycosylase [Bacillota bacterium]MBQ6013379.1 DNA-deoxyinosine glycosylase [Bacillota bacterium]MBQ6260872.1 DNA-deoxyinosine glycosylase [Bacillota bacterium]MBR0114740.1 DNA-deoxyinosine glycosylase [Bacillota bacterium]MBR0441733.1 DNA-deoxyinosine glycosylase [Bacillota bacterium]